MAVPFGQLPIGDGRLPDGGTAPFFIDRGELEIVRLDGPAWKFQDARFIPESVADPDVIFEGLRRPNQSESLCYSVRPTQDPDEEQDEIAAETIPRYGYVFLAFVYLGMMGYVVFDWEWREEDPDQPGHPVNWATDFARRAWYRT
jgi:hypothetical protein